MIRQKNESAYAMNWTVFQSRLMIGSVMLIVTGGTSWAGWMTASIMDIQTRLGSVRSDAEILSMIENHAPYSRDEPLIKYQLDSIQKKLDSIEKKLEQRMP